MNHRHPAVPTLWPLVARHFALALALTAAACSSGGGAETATPGDPSNADSDGLPDAELRDAAGSTPEAVTGEGSATDVPSYGFDARLSPPEASTETTPHDAGSTARETGPAMLPPKDASSDTRAPSVDAGSQSDAAVSDADLQFCVDENNRYRATLAVAPLARSAKLEQFAAIGAQVDYAAATAHTHFTTSKGVPGAQRSAENEIPGFGGWSLRRQKTLHAIISQGLAAMWAEGPGGGHYDNMKDAALHNVGCGVFIANNAEQDVTVTIDFTN